MKQIWTDCPAGYYSEKSSGSLWYSCAPCPEGSHCPMRGDTATTCAAGFFSPLGVHLPLPTRAGWKAGGGVDIRPCEAGQTSDDFSDTCYTCQAGEVCSFPSNRRMVCNEGFYSDTTGLFTCKECPVNTYFDSGS